VSSTLAADQDSGNDPAAIPPHGEFAAAVRSAGYPCAHVIAIDPVRTGLWSVRCNAGYYTVKRDETGRLAVAMPE
jgi:hypothetical protein